MKAPFLPPWYHIVRSSSLKALSCWCQGQNWAKWSFWITQLWGFCYIDGKHTYMMNLVSFSCCPYQNTGFFTAATYLYSLMYHCNCEKLVIRMLQIEPVLWMYDWQSEEWVGGWHGLMVHVCNYILQYVENYLNDCLNQTLTGSYVLRFNCWGDFDRHYSLFFHTWILQFQRVKGSQK